MTSLRKSNFRKILNLKSNPTLPFVNISVPSPRLNFRAFLDSGASLSLIDKNLYLKLGLELNPNDKVQISVANGEKNFTLGSVVLDIPQFQQKCRFQVLAGMTVPVLIGYDILMNFVPNFPQRKLFLNKGFLPIYHDCPTVTTNQIINFVENTAYLSDQVKLQVSGLENPHFYHPKSGEICKIENGAFSVPSGEIESNFDLDPENNEVIGEIFDFSEKILNLTHSRNPDIPENFHQVSDLGKIDINPDLPPLICKNI